MDRGIDRPLSLISAPAGFGKTALATEWLQAYGRPVAWLSLDSGDKDPMRFLTHVVAALQAVNQRVGTRVMTWLDDPDPQLLRSALVWLLNDIEALPEPTVLVLDDYHAVEAAAVDEIVLFLVEHAGRRLHLLITTREDPQLPLARLRSRDQVTEIRASDLRFTYDETAMFLTEVMNLTIEPDAIFLLNARTEGWIAGLQLAALSLEDSEDVNAFVSDFAGDNRFVMDYLLSEVLSRQSQRQRDFLLFTSVLGRLNGPLCDALTGQGDGAATLEALERSNFFVVPLDDRRYWYRYHHLFAGVLSARLRSEHAELVPTLHVRASRWFEAQGNLPSAVEHALKAGDFEQAARVIQLVAPELRKTRQEAVLLGWMSALPAEELRTRPSLSVLNAHVLLASGRLEDAKALLDSAENQLGLTFGSSPDHVGDGVDESLGVERSRLDLLASIGIAQAGLALARGDVDASERLACRVLALASPDDHFTRGGALGFFGLALWSRGDIVSARRTYESSVSSLEAAGNLADAVAGHTALASMSLALGQLNQAKATLARGLNLAMAQGPASRGVGDMYVGLAEIAYEMNDLTQAAAYLGDADAVGEPASLPRNAYRRHVVWAKVRAAQAQFTVALNLLEEAERRFVSDFHPNVKPIAAERVRLWIANGQLDEAFAWARQLDLRPNEEIDYLREFEYLTLARVLIARTFATGDRTYASEAIPLLWNMLSAAEAGHRLGSVISVLVLLALSHRALGDISSAVRHTDRALALTESQGHVRVFLDEGPEMVELLLVALRGRKGSEHVWRLRAACSREAKAAREGLVARPGDPMMLEPLSERELQVLRLLKSELAGPEIARHLKVSVNTLRTHTKNVYGKLEVGTRRAAVLRGEELGLI